MKLRHFLVGCAVLLAYWSMQPLRAIPKRPATRAPLAFEAVRLPAASGPFRLAGAWRITSPDPRWQGLSGLGWDGRRLAAVSDTGFAWRFASPLAGKVANGDVRDLRDGPGPFGRKVGRDAEALVRDPQGQGWWVAFEQFHSLWHYDDDFARSDRTVWLDRPDWSYNKGAEGLAPLGHSLLALGEQGRDAVVVKDGQRLVLLRSDWMIADAARAPDGTVWLLLRHHYGIEAALAPLRAQGRSWIVGPKIAVPKALFDNLEGLTIQPLGAVDRFWIVSDDGHRLFARTVLIALDLPRTQQSARR